MSATVMNEKLERTKDRELMNGEVKSAMIEIEHLLHELERSRSIALGDALSTKLEAIEDKVGKLEKLIRGAAASEASARLNDLMERIIASRIRSDLESSVQALHLVQSYLTENSGGHVRKEEDPAAPVDSPERSARPGDEPSSPRFTQQSQSIGDSEDPLHRILEHAETEDYREITKLSKRKREIIYHLLLGKRNREIAEELGITEKTVKNNLYTIYRILRVKSRSQLLHRLLNPLKIDSPQGA